MQQFVTKITSRKFVIALAMFVISILMMCGVIGGDETFDKGFILNIVSVVTYILGESGTDIASIMRSDKNE